MDADTLVIFGTSKVVRVCAGKAAIAGFSAGVGALVRVPVVTGVVVSNDVLESMAVFNKIIINDDSSRANCLVVCFDKFLLSARFVHNEHLVRFILTGCHYKGFFFLLKKLKSIGSLCISTAVLTS